MKVALFAVVLCAASAQVAAAGEGLAFPVVPPEQYAFNYPDPPLDGAKDYFRIAEGGEARCVIVRAKDAGPRAQAAATGLATYLQLVTGAKFKVLEDGQAPAAGLGVIHVGDTAVSRRVELKLPDVRYGDGSVYPNLNGYLVQTVDEHTL